ncbi:threonine-phosphate decarboxylase CobD [Bacillus alveayuensis]|uniref:threonine-phosphate decarboxylase CobD n=1 Tax=Aeribacillus alveayuensis TaxID=279215 RepID=UPI0005CCB405|nr:threonine-phosphate decarboxylase CobD [Bacillus alveayuensis]
MKLPSHGSNPFYLYESLQIPLLEKQKRIDFSVNINPFGPPPMIREKWQSYYISIEDYPDPYCLQLKELISKKEHVKEKEIFIGNGASEIIFILASALLKNKKVLIVEPTFSEYQKACETFGCQVSSFLLESEKNWELYADELLNAIHEVEAIFICHPHNPTGKAFQEKELYQILKEAAKQNTFVIIDEAFYDFSTQNHSMVQYLQKFPNLIILRSLTKMFAIAGIRLGYALGHEAVLEKLKKYQPEWSVNAIAQKIGALCLKDDEHVKRTQQWMEKERNRVSNELRKLGFDVSDSQVNFYLLNEPEKQDLKELIVFLLKHGIVPRHTYNFRGLEGRYLRLAIKKREENDRLMEVLQKWRKICSYL